MLTVLKYYFSFAFVISLSRNTQLKEGSSLSLEFFTFLQLPELEDKKSCVLVKIEKYCTMSRIVSQDLDSYNQTPKAAVVTV